jgi:hypothetical protein
MYVSVRGVRSLLSGPPVRGQSAVRDVPADVALQQIGQMMACGRTCGSGSG